jgi:2,3-dihydroxybenzoate decarboxylase
MRVPKIAIEEHVSPSGTVDRGRELFSPEAWERMRRALVDIHGQLLNDMDEHNVEMSVLSLVAPGIQHMTDPKMAAEAARRSNDQLANQVAKNPKRFQAFAALPMNDPQASAEELTRCVKELGFKGALVDSFSSRDSEESVLYYDLPEYWDFWGTCESLDVPFYLHPREPLVSRTLFLEGYPWLRTSSWAFTLDMATHMLRLMSSGLFDQYPKLKIIVGHMGETLPFLMWRVDNRIKKSPRGIPARKPLNEYFTQNFWITTSGQFNTQALMEAINWMGEDRIMFSVDYPFEVFSDAAPWFDSVNAISEAAWNKIARTNAEKLLKLDLRAEKPKAAAV